MPIAIATNNGDIGGGEVMLLNLARALRSAGYPVTVVGPEQPGELVEAAYDEGFDTVALSASTKKQYMVQLRAWDLQVREGILWCNGLVPSVATGGHRDRVVHLHQLPRTAGQRLLVKPAQRRSLLTLLPSRFAAEKVPGAQSFYNWVSAVDAPLQRRSPAETIRVGFLGRPSVIKGTDVLAQAVAMLNAESAKKYQLVIAGEPKFIDSTDQAKMNRALDQLGESTITLGWVTPADFFQQIDVLAVPSVVDETFGLVAAEAMSARVPLVVSDAGALPEVVGEDYPWIAQSGNAANLAAKISGLSRQVIEHSDQLTETLADLYWRWLELFSPESGIDRLRQLFENLNISE